MALYDKLGYITNYDNVIFENVELDTICGVVSIQSDLEIIFIRVE